MTAAEFVGRGNVNNEIPEATEVVVLEDEVAVTGLAVALLHRWNVAATGAEARVPAALTAAKKLPRGPAASKRPALAPHSFWPVSPTSSTSPSLRGYRGQQQPMFIGTQSMYPLLPVSTGSDSYRFHFRFLRTPPPDKKALDASKAYVSKHDWVRTGKAPAHA